MVMALFIAALATIIVSGLFWRQFVVVRTIENQQVQAQSRMLLRGALDWARAILREDARTTSVDASTSSARPRHWRRKPRSPARSRMRRRA